MSDREGGLLLQSPFHMLMFNTVGFRQTHTHKSTHFSLQTTSLCEYLNLDKLKAAASFDVLNARLH